MLHLENLMIKHVGKHNSKKIVVLYRQVPGEEHMCLVTYTETLPRTIHDDLMKALESPAGQQAKELSEVLFRTLGTSGRSILGTLHGEGFIKKVPTNQVLITPNTASSVRLDELNKILNEMSLGEEAVKKLEQLEKDKGMTGKAIRKKSGAQPVTESTAITKSDILSDTDIANNLREQAARMAAEAKTLLQESDRLMKEASAMLPQEKETVTADVKPKSKSKKTTTKVQAN